MTDEVYDLATACADVIEMVQNPNIPLALGPILTRYARFYARSKDQAIDLAIAWHDAGECAGFCSFPLDILKVARRATSEGGNP